MSMTDVHCIQCGGTNINVDASVVWCVDKQEFEVEQVWEKGAYCGDCDSHDARWEHRPVNPMEDP